jgi:RNA polymerase sigma-70 factor (ECF subfamily)
VSIPARTAPAPLLCAAGPQDVEELYRAYSGSVARWASRLGGPGIDVDDIVQEVFLVAKRRLRTFTGEGRVTTWLFRTTANITATARRQRRLATWLGRAEAERPGLGADAPLPGEALEQRQQAELVYRALDGLPERLRRVLILFEMEELSTQEISALMNARDGTVRVWLFRARAKFQERYRATTAGGDREGDVKR